jgi:hypothetical protein
VELLIKQKEQLDGYKKASIIKGLLFDYERILQDLTLEQLVKRITITDSRTRQIKPMYQDVVQEHEMTWGKEYE